MAEEPNVSSIHRVDWKTEAHDHGPSQCDYCEQNWYDERECPTCDGTGGTDTAPCEECQGHGFQGYSW